MPTRAINTHSVIPAKAGISVLVVTTPANSGSRFRGNDPVVGTA